MGMRPVDDRLDPAATGVHHHAHPIALLLAHRLEVDPRIGDRLPAGAHREVDEPGHPPRHLGVHHRTRVEVQDLGRDPDLVLRRVEALDRSACRSRRPAGSPSRSGSHCRWA
ncbi:MAG: hypothetical protein WKF78_05975 [Candidatus Limnocylindrales bacterium]